MYFPSRIQVILVVFAVFSGGVGKTMAYDRITGKAFASCSEVIAQPGSRLRRVSQFLIQRTSPSNRSLRKIMTSACFSFSLAV